MRCTSSTRRSITSRAVTEWEEAARNASQSHLPQIRLKLRQSVRALDGACPAPFRAIAAHRVYLQPHWGRAGRSDRGAGNQSGVRYRQEAPPMSDRRRGWSPPSGVRPIAATATLRAMSDVRPCRRVEDREDEENNRKHDACHRGSASLRAKPLDAQDKAKFPWSFLSAEYLPAKNTDRSLLGRGLKAGAQSGRVL